MLRSVGMGFASPARRHHRPGAGRLRGTSRSPIVQSKPYQVEPPARPERPLKTVRPPRAVFGFKAPARFPGWMLHHSLPMVADTWASVAGASWRCTPGSRRQCSLGPGCSAGRWSERPSPPNGLGSASGGTLTPEEVALRRGGPPLAVTVAALDLRPRGTLEPLEGHRGRMRAAGSGPPSGNPLAGALWDAVAMAGRPVWAPQLRRRRASMSPAWMPLSRRWHASVRGSSRERGRRARWDRRSWPGSWPGRGRIRWAPPTRP